MPEKTKAEFREDGFFVSGDLGFIDEKGYVHIVGRDKDLIISGGFNVYPKEVEAAIQALPGVVDATVIGVPHPDFGEGVVAIVVPQAGARLDERQMQTALAGVAPFLAPLVRHLRASNAGGNSPAGQIEHFVIGHAQGQRAPPRPRSPH